MVFLKNGGSHLPMCYACSFFNILRPLKWLIALGCPEFYKFIYLGGNSQEGAIELVFRDCKEYLGDSNDPSSMV